MNEYIRVTNLQFIHNEVVTNCHFHLMNVVYPSALRTPLAQRVKAAKVKIALETSLKNISQESIVDGNPHRHPRTDSRPLIATLGQGCIRSRPPQFDASSSRVERMLE
jgi:hypothetical protein